MVLSDVLLHGVCNIQSVILLTGGCDRFILCLLYRGVFVLLAILLPGGCRGSVCMSCCMKSILSAECFSSVVLPGVR